VDLSAGEGTRLLENGTVVLTADSGTVTATHRYNDSRTATLALRAPGITVSGDGGSDGGGSDGGGVPIPGAGGATGVVLIVVGALLSVVVLVAALIMAFRLAA